MHALRFAQFNCRLKISGVNADSFVFKFSNVDIYCLRGSAESFGILVYFDPFMNSGIFYKYKFLAGGYGFRIMLDGSTVQGTNVGNGNSIRLISSVWYM